MAIVMQGVEGEWHIYASVNLAIIDLDNYSARIGRQAIKCTDDKLLVTGPLGIYVSEFAEMHKNSQ